MKSLSLPRVSSGEHTLPSSSFSAASSSEKSAQTSSAGETKEAQSFAKKLQEAKEQPPATVPFKERLALAIKGVPMFLGLLIGATAYWLVFVWDIKNLERRTRHYRLKLFNTWMTYFRPVSVSQWGEWRQHECEHCGACCEILWRCPFLKTDEDGSSHCSVHSKRPLPCRTFPIDPRSVEMISKHRDLERSCSYRFALLIDQMIEDDKQASSTHDSPP